MDKTIEYLEDLGMSLSRLARLCFGLSFMSESLTTRPSSETIQYCFQALDDILDAKAAEIDKVVSEYYKARAGEPANKP